MRECIAITTYCDTKEKINALNRTIDNNKIDALMSGGGLKFLNA